MRSDFDVNTDNPSFAHSFDQACIKNERSPMRNPCFNNHIGLYAVDEFLNANQIFWKLDDWPAKPRKAINIFVIPTAA